MINCLRNILFIVLLLSCIKGNAQETKSDIEKKANKYFQQDDFSNALPLYLRLLSLEPRNHSFNYRYGACLLMASENKGDAFQYLKFATSGGDVEDEAFYFLGKAYHLQYNFSNAIKNYEIYKRKAGNRAAKKLDVHRQIEMGRNGKRLLRNNMDVIVLEKKSTARENFFRSYDFTNIDGQILVTEMFQSKQDKRLNHVPIIHFPDDSKQIFYASYADKADQKDIYTRTRNKDGKWSDEILVSGNINTSFDEDYPFFHASTSYLYFSSKGHNSMGGYDLFRCKYDLAKNTCNQVENLDFPLSSADDDLLYIADSLGEHAFMASTRESPSGRIHVYDIRVDRVPMQLVVVKGVFNSEIDPSGKPNAEITVRDPNNGRLISSTETSSRGDYLLSFPNAGKYELEIVQKDRNTKVNEIVEIPRQKVFAPIMQTITEKLEEGSPVIVINNRFDEVVTDEEILAELARNRARLKVNKQNFNLDQLANQQVKEQLLSEIGLGNYNNQEIKDFFLSQFDNAVQRNENVQLRRNQSQNTILELNSANEKLELEIEEALNEAESTKELKLKRKLVQKAEEKTEQIRKNDKVLAESLLVLEKLDDIEDDTKEIVKKTGKMKSIFEKVDINDQDAFAAALVENEALLKEVTKSKIAIDPIFEWQEEIAENVREVNAKQEQLQQLSQRKQALDEEVAGLKRKMEVAKKRELDDLEIQLATLEQEQENVSREMAYQKRTMQKLERETLDESTLRTIDQANADQPITSFDNNEIETTKKARSENVVNASERITQKSDELAEQATDLSTDSNDQTEDQVNAAENEWLSDFSKTEEALNNYSEMNSEQLQSWQENLEEQKASLEKLDLTSAKKQELMSKLERQKSRVKLQRELNELAESLNQDGTKNSSAKISALTEEINSNDNLSDEEKSAFFNQLEKIQEQLDTELQSTTDIASNELEIYEQQLEDIIDEIAKNENLESQKTEIDKLNNQIVKNDNISGEQKADLLANLEQVKNDLSDALNEANNDLAENQTNIPNNDNLNRGENQDDDFSMKRLQVEEKDYPQKLAQTTNEINAGNLSKQEALLQLKAIQDELEKDLNELENELSAETEVGEDAQKWLIELGYTLSNIREEMDKLEDEIEEEKSAIQELIANIDPSFEEEVELIQNEIRSGEKMDKDLKDRLEIYKQKLEGAQSQVLKNIEDNPRDWKAKATEQLLANEIQTISEQISAITTDPAFIASESNRQEVTQLKELLSDLDDFDLSPTNELSQRENLQKRLTEKRNELSTDEQLESFSENERLAVIEELEEAIKENQKRIDSLTATTTDEVAGVTDSSDEKVEQDAQLAQQDRVLTTEESSGDWSNDEIAMLNKLGISFQALSPPSNKSSKENLVSYSNNLRLINDRLSAHLPNAQATEKELINSVISKNKENMRKATIWIDDLEQAQIKELVASRDQANDEVLNSIEAEQNELEQVRAQKEQVSAIPEGERTKKEQRQLAILEKEEAKIQAKINEQKAQLLNDEIDNIKQELPDDSELLNAPSIQEIETAIEIQNIALQQSKSDEEKSSIGKTLNQQKLMLINELSESKQQEEVTSRVETIQNEIGYQPNSNTQHEKALKQAQVNQTRANLRQNEQQVLALEKLLPSAKRKDKRKINDLIAELKEKNSQLSTSLEQEEQELKIIANHRNQTKEKGVPSNAIQSSVKYEEELEMAKSEEYRALLNDRNRLLQKQYEWKVKDEQLIELERELAQLKSLLSEEDDETVLSSMQKTLEQISQLNSEIADLESEIRTVQASIASQLPEDPRAAEIIANLLIRDVDPIDEVPVFRRSISRVPIGVAFTESDDRPTYSDENPIPIANTDMDGLVYRIQIGAFSRPVPNETFNEFSPISGEEVRPGLIRYMAGYFPSRVDATVARNQIRNLGYSDAFLVAYCNGERIPIYRAQQLQASGVCVPKMEDSSGSLIVSTQQETEAEQSDEVNSFAYNQAPGAASATAVETKMGLFFTVQVGVYNKPIKSEQLYNIEPLMTRRLDNGQIRYSTGMFDHVEEAQEKRKYAVDKGVKDAFIVAYYKGERLTVRQAQDLLAEFGSEILESTTPTVVERNEVRAPENRPTPPKPVPFLENKETHIRLVSNDTYEVFPFQEMNRWNEKGSLFYYDVNSMRVYSELMSSDAMKNVNIAQLQEFTKEFYFEGRKIKDINAINPVNTIDNSANPIWQVTINLSLLNSSYRIMNYYQHSRGLKKMHFSNEGKLRLVWYEKTEDDAQQRLIELQQFGLEAEIITDQPINWNK